MRVYVDTNVYLDYLLARANTTGVPLDLVAFQVFERARSCEFEIILSDHVLEELYHYTAVGESRILLDSLRPKIRLVWASDEDRVRARSLPAHFADALHIALARRAGAAFIVTRNVADFRHLIETKRPEEV